MDCHDSRRRAARKKRRLSQTVVVAETVIVGIVPESLFELSEPKGEKVWTQKKRSPHLTQELEQANYQYYVLDQPEHGGF